MNITGSNLHARCFGGSRRLYVVFQRIRAYFVRKLSGAHVSSVARAKPRAEAKKRQAPSTSRNLFFVASSFGLLRHTKARRKASPRSPYAPPDGNSELGRRTKRGNVWEAQSPSATLDASGSQRSNAL
jgi:hypothetical protein